MTHDDIDAGEPLRDEGETAEEGGSFERNLVFVAAPLAGAGSQAAYAAITSECLALGLRAVTVTAGPAEGPVIGQITALIRRAEFLICDLTGEQPDICYALGYAHGAGNEMADVLLLAQEAAALRFDLAPLPVRRYRSLEDLRAVVAAGLSDMMQQTRR